MRDLAVPRLHPGLALCALAGALLLTWSMSGAAQAKSVVGPDGQIHGCYKKKGKQKGALRVVPPRKKCRKGEKRLAWNAQGQGGQPGQNGVPGGSGSTSTKVLENRVTVLESQVSQLTSQLTQLTGQVATLQGILAGISHQDLTNALANVDSLCSEMSSVVDYARGVGDVLDALDVGLPLLNLGTLIPTALSAYACPQP
jgi:hypothetical protein